jgi:hypothetical protein
VVKLNGVGSLAFLADTEELIKTLLRVSTILLANAASRTTIKARDIVPPNNVLCYGSPLTRRSDPEAKRSDLEIISLIPLKNFINQL